LNDTLDKASSAALTVQETKDGSLTLYSADLKEHYHSKFGAVAESDTVFVENTGVANRLARLQPTRVLEIGFGTGLNFIRTAIHARIYAQSIQFEAAIRDHPHRGDLPRLSCGCVRRDLPRRLQPEKQPRSVAVAISAKTAQKSD